MDHGQNTDNDAEQTLLDRRTYLKGVTSAAVVGGVAAGSGTAAAATTSGYGGGGYGTEAYGDPVALTVSTDAPLTVDDGSLTLAGTLEYLGGVATVSVFFEWGPAGAGLPNETTAQSLSATGEFSALVGSLSPATTYEYRAVAVSGSGDRTTGTTRTVTTHATVAVTTDRPTGIGATTTTLNGAITELGGADSATVGFEWGPVGSGYPNETAGTTVTSPGTFAADISGLDPGTAYECRAVARADDGDDDTGSAVTFTTDSAATPPAVDGYAVTEKGSPNPHASITADWRVSDADGDLATVVVEVSDSAGQRLDSRRTAVSGCEATGTDTFRFKRVGRTSFSVRLRVTDASGNGTATGKTVSS